MKRILALLLLAATPAAAADPPLPVVASFSILGDMVREIGRDRVTVTALVGPDGDAHVFQPSPRDVALVAGARVFVVNGLGLEGWLGRLTEAAAFTGSVVTATSGIAPLVKGGEPDPHAWQDVADAEIYARTIAAGLAAADPAHADEYRANGEAYATTLAGLDRWVRDEIAAVPPERRRMITTHDAFAYFGRAYGVRVEAPVGMTEDAEPSAAAVAALIREVRSGGVRALFIENMTDPRLIARLADEAGVTPGGRLFADALSKPGEGGETYVAMIRHNVPLMVAAMGRN
jgi:zinc/manganese transport system substrate-binding protein